jgi:hypothetical protein
VAYGLFEVEGGAHPRGKLSTTWKRSQNGLRAPRRTDVGQEGQRWYLKLVLRPKKWSKRSNIMSHTAEVVFGILLIFLIIVFVEIIRYLNNDIRSLRERIDVVAWKVDSIESTMKQLDKKIEEVIDRRFNYSLTNLYDENQLLGHEWQYKIDEGHWVTVIYNEKTKKFIVKHFRTDENIQKINLGERIASDMKHNAENIYGGMPDNARGMRLSNGIYVPEE